MVSLKLSPTTRYLLCFVVIFASSFHFSSGFQWIHTPKAKTVAGIGKSVAVRWHYSLSSNESHVESDLTFLRGNLLSSIATRDATADSFLSNENDYLGEFEVQGKKNVSLIIKSVQKTCDGLLCLQVKYKHRGSIQLGMSNCTKLYAIGSNVSDSVKVDVEVVTDHKTLLIIVGAVVAGVVFVFAVVCCCRFCH